MLHLVVLYAPEAGGAPGVPFLDKGVHALVFGVVAFTGLRAGFSRPLVVGALVAHAPVSEIVQATFLRARSGDPADVVADLVGVVLGVVMSGLASRGRRGIMEA